jgi:ssDNA-binding replication factor A large subunit
LDVLNSKKEWDVVTVHGKILTLKEPRTVGSPRKRLKLMEAVLADETGTIPLDLWESNIGQINKGQVYSLNQLQVRMWSAKKKTLNYPENQLFQSTNRHWQEFNNI